MSSELFSTGRTSGITAIPPQTLRRYVQDFKEFFSESAQKPTKGRRFTSQDINNLLLIRHLYFERTSPDRIRAALRGEWAPAAAPQYNNQDALLIVEAAQKRMEATKGYVKEAKQAAYQANNVVDAARHILERFREVIEGGSPDYQARINALERRITTLETTLNQQRSKRGLFNLGG